MIVPTTDPTARTRFRLLETLRQYALERLDDTGQAEEYRRRHAEHYAGVRRSRRPRPGRTRRGRVVPALRRRARQPPRRGRLGPRRRSPGRRRAGPSDHRPARRPVLLSPVGRRGRVGRSRSGARRKLDPRPALRSARRRGLESGASKATSTSRPHACVRGVARRAPPGHALPRMGA